MVTYPVEDWADHKDCSKGMDISAPFGWWCALHNVDLRPEDNESS